MTAIAIQIPSNRSTLEAPRKVDLARPVRIIVAPTPRLQSVIDSSLADVRSYFAAPELELKVGTNTSLISY